MGSDARRDASVFDILYADTRRLSSLLSQFSDDGIVTELVRAAEASDSNQVGLNIKIAKAEGTSGSRETATRKIDPQWLLPLLFLDEAAEHIHRDITTAAIGSIVLVSGRLVMTDLSLIQRMWQTPSARKVMIKQMLATSPDEAAPANRQRRRSGKLPAPDTTDQEFLLDLLASFPHTIHMNIVTDHLCAWSSIEPSYMIGAAADLLLKHGAKIAGHWSMVGILDATPFEYVDDDTEYDEVLTPNQWVRLGMGGENIWKVATELAPGVRQAVGRPSHAYGLTPLVIFREIET